MQTPVVTKSELTDRFYVVTSYEVLSNGVIRAKRKFDVTDQIESLANKGLLPQGIKK